MVKDHRGNPLPGRHQGNGLWSNSYLTVVRAAGQSRRLFRTQQVVVADEPGGEDVGRLGIQSFRVTALYDLSFVHQDNAIRQRQRFFLIVGNEDGRQVQFTLDPTDLFAQVLTDTRVQCRKGLVEQQQPRTGHQRTCQRHPLALSTGQLMRIAFRQLSQLHQRQHLLHPLLDLTGRQLLHFQPERDVALNGHVRE